MVNKYTFQPYGVVVSCPSGNVTLNAGQNMTILPQGDLITFASQTTPNVFLTGIPWQPPTLTDAKAPNNSLYYSSTLSGLTYKNSFGVSIDLSSGIFPGLVTASSFL